MGVVADSGGHIGEGLLETCLLLTLSLAFASRMSMIIHRAVVVMAAARLLRTPPSKSTRKDRRFTSDIMPDR